MVAISTTQVGIANMNGLAELFRKRSAGKIVNDGDVRSLNGFSVDVTGTNTRREQKIETAIQAGKGVRTFKPEAASALMAPSTLSASLRTQDVNFSRDQMEAVRNRSIEGTPLEGMAIAESAVITRTETLPVEQVQGIGYYDRAINSREEDIAYLSGMLARGGELADIEDQLSEEYGEPVKLAWDAASEEYLMLRQGQDGYDRVNSAREVFETDVNRTLGQMGYTKNDFREVLEQYGVQV